MKTRSNYALRLPATLARRLDLALPVSADAIVTRLGEHGGFSQAAAAMNCLGDAPSDLASSAAALLMDVESSRG